MLFKYVESLIANYFSQSNHGGYLNCGSGERRKKKEWVTCLQYYWLLQALGRAYELISNLGSVYHLVFIILYHFAS